MNYNVNPGNELEYLRARVSQLEEALNKQNIIVKYPTSGLDDSVFPHLINSIGDFVVITDDNGKILYINQAITDKFGYTHEE